MSYEKFITDFLNIKPTELSKISTSTGSDGSVFIWIRLSKKSVLRPYCNGNAKVKAYYYRKLTHSTFANRFCYISYEQRRYLCKNCSCSITESNRFSASREKLTDEHYFSSSDHRAKYCCLLMNFETGEMVDVLPDRKKAYLTQYF